MSILNIVGFDTGSLDEFNGLWGTGSVQSGITKSPGYALKCNPTTTGLGAGVIQKIGTNGASGVGFASNDLYSRFYFRVDTLPASAIEELYSVEVSGTGFPLSIRIDSSGRLAAYNLVPSQVALGTTHLSTATWYLFEIHNQVGASGAYELKINGVTEFSGTTNQGANKPDIINLGKRTNFNGQSVVYYFDNFIVSDSGFLGAGTTTMLVPAANGNYQNWSIGAGSGSHYQVVGGVPPSAASYLVSAATNNETEAVQTRAQAGITVGPVNVVKGVIYCLRDGGTNGSIKACLRSNGTDALTSVARTTTSAYDFTHNLLLTDPATSAAWTAAGLDTLEMGASNLSANQSRMSAAYVYVDYGPVVATFNASSFNANIGTGF